MHNPLELLPKVHELTVSINKGSNQFDLTNYSKMFGIEGGEDRSPQITWTNVPEGTKSFVISMYDPDAPTESGFWHWMVKDIPSNQNVLVEDSGNLNVPKLPEGAKHVLTDARVAGYIGAAPPKGETHRYHILVSALDIEKLEVDEQATPAFVEFMMAEHVIARGYRVIQGSL